MNKNSGIDFVDVLTLLFITLKLIGVINWSRWWVLSPMLIYFVIILIIVIFK